MPSASFSAILVTADELFGKEVTTLFKKSFPASTNFKICSFNEILNHAELSSPSAVLIDFSQQSEAAVSLIKRIASKHHNSKLICLGHPSDAATILEFLKVGVKDFLELPLDENEIRLFLNSFTNSQTGSKIKEGSAKVVTLFSPKGGSGVTLVAANLAVVLAKTHQSRVVVCDLSPQCGDVSAYLNLHPTFTLRDLIDNKPFLDHSFLEGVLTRHSSGVKVLAAPTHDQEASHVDHLPELETIFNLLIKNYDTVLIDGGHLEPAVLQYAVAASDMVILVGNPDVASLKGLVNAFNKLKHQNIAESRIKVVINRYNSKSQIDTNEFEKKTKHPIAARLPNNYLLCIEAVNTGHSLLDLQEKSELAKKISGLAAMIHHLTPENNHNGSGAKSGTKFWTSKPFSFLQRKN